MRKLLFFLPLLLIGACNKSDTSGTVPGGSVKFSNYSTNPYRVYIDGSGIATVNGASWYKTDATITVGRHNWQVIQISGYVVTPTSESGYIDVVANKESDVIFP